MCSLLKKKKSENPRTHFFRPRVLGKTGEIPRTRVLKKWDLGFSSFRLRFRGDFFSEDPDRYVRTSEKNEFWDFPIFFFQKSAHSDWSYVSVFWPSRGPKRVNQQSGAKAGSFLYGWEGKPLLKPTRFGTDLGRPISEPNPEWADGAVWHYPQKNAQKTAQSASYPGSPGGLHMSEHISWVPII